MENVSKHLWGLALASQRVFSLTCMFQRNEIFQTLTSRVVICDYNKTQPSIWLSFTFQSKLCSFYLRVTDKKMDK